jgi:tight adherence protein B
MVWLAAVLIATAVLVSRPRQASGRLAGFTSPPESAPTAAVRLDRSALLVAVMLGSGLVALHLPIGFAAAAGVVPPAVSWVRARRRARQDRDAREAAVVEVTFALAAELRAGRTTKEALSAAAATAGPLAPVLSAAAASVDVGGSAAAELEAGSELPGAARLRIVAATWQVTEAAGGRVALVLERLGEAMDREDALRREMQAALAAPQATMTLLAGLPVVGLGFGQLIGAHPVHLLLYRPIGWALLAGAAALDSIGILISRRLAKWALK